MNDNARIFWIKLGYAFWPRIDQNNIQKLEDWFKAQISKINAYIDIQKDKKSSQRTNNFEALPVADRYVAVGKFYTELAGAFN